MRRTLTATADVIQSAMVPINDDLPSWLQAETAHLGPCWLLAHADDGIIWGLVDGVHCQTSFGAGQQSVPARQVCPPLRWATLQTIRLFSEAGELLAWNDADRGWRARRIQRALSAEDASLRRAFDEDQVLWGDRGLPLAAGPFSLMSDGAQGLLHAVPLPDAAGDHAHRPLRLRIRHYVSEDDSGYVRVSQSRLVRLFVEDSHAV